MRGQTETQTEMFRYIPLEMLIKSLLLQVLYGIRSEKQIPDHLEFNLLYRWFVGLKADDKIWDETVFSKNRNRILGEEVINIFFSKVVAVANKKNLF
jgi:transposase